MKVWIPKVLVLKFAPLATGPTQVAIPERASEQLKLECTAALRTYVPPFAGAEMVTAGGVVSILIGPTFIVLTLPARSMHVPATVTPVEGVLAVRVVPPVGKPGATPERLSVQVNPTATDVLFHPAAFGAGVRDAAITGGVASRLIVTVLELNRPAPFVAEHVTARPTVSVVTDVEPQPVEDAIPDSGSTALQVTVTLLTYQPFRPSVPEIVGVITGGVLSMMTLRVWLDVCGWQLETLPKQLESVTWTVKVKVPPVAGVVPLMTPALLRLRPVGSAPDWRAQVTFPNPPVASREAE